MGNIISIVLSRENLYQEEEYKPEETRIDILSEYSDRDWIYYHMERDNGVDILG